mgnify:FL=1
MNPLLAALVQLGILSQQDAERISRQLNPAMQRQYAEATLVDALTRALGAQRRRIISVVDAANGRPTARQLSLFWRGEDVALWGDVQETIQGIALESAVTVAIRNGSSTWDLINQNVIDWTTNYYTSEAPAMVGSIPNLNQTSRQQFADVFLQWQQGTLDTVGSKEGLPQLVQALEPVFGRARAERIGVTETTRVFAESDLAVARSDPFIEYVRWNAANDELMCDVCAPLNGQVVPKGEMFEGDLMPPAHPNCRCWLSFETENTMQIASN